MRIEGQNSCINIRFYQVRAQPTIRAWAPETLNAFRYLHLLRQFIGKIYTNLVCGYFYAKSDVRGNFHIKEKYLRSGG